LHLKNNELSTPHTRKLSKGVSKIVLKFPHDVILHTRKFWNSFISLPFLCNGLLEISVDWSLAANLDDLRVSIPFLLTKWKQ
jgi:hypothetical protein